LVRWHLESLMTPIEGLALQKLTPRVTPRRYVGTAVL